MKLLWVENHATFARTAARCFLAGHAVTVVPSLAAARTALAAGTFDAVLIDFDLDDGKGTELVRELTAAGPRPAVIAVSAHEDGNRQLLAAGADAVCDKLRFNRIADVLESLLR